MTKSVSGKQVKEFLDRFNEDEIATMCCHIQTAMGEAAQAYYDTVNKLAETYPELWVFCGFNTSVVSSDNVHSEFVKIHIGPADPGVGGTNEQ